MRKRFADVTEQIAIIGENTMEEAPKIVRYDGVANRNLPKGIVSFKGIGNVFLHPYAVNIRKVTRSNL